MWPRAGPGTSRRLAAPHEDTGKPGGPVHLVRLSAVWLARPYTLGTVTRQPTADAREDGRDLAIRTTAAVLAGAAGPAGPDVAAVGTALTPAMEVAFSAVVRGLNQRRFRHGAQTLSDAAGAAGEPVEELLAKAVADDRRQELLARALSIAQDAALRDKRRALGRSLAAGIAGDDAQIDDELLFIRAVADIDRPQSGCSR